MNGTILVTIIQNIARIMLTKALRARDGYKAEAVQAYWTSNKNNQLSKDGPIPQIERAINTIVASRASSAGTKVPLDDHDDHDIDL